MIYQGQSRSSRGGGGGGIFWGVSLSFFQGEQRWKGHSSLTQFKGMTIKE